MDFVSAVKSCFAQYAGFSGRAPRSEFWWFALFQFGVLVIATMISQVLYGIAALALLLPALAVGARRLHDICLLYTSPSPRDRQKSRMPSSA